MRSLPVFGMLSALSTTSTETRAQLTPVSVQIHGEAHAMLTPPVGPPQAQMDVDDLAVMGDVNSIAQLGQSTSGPFAIGNGASTVNVFGSGYRVASSGFASGRAMGSAVAADGEADAMFIFNIDQACTIDLAMTFVVDLPDLPGTGSASTMFEFRGPGNSLIYSLSLNQPTGNALHIDQSFILLPGQYQMATQSMADLQIPAFGTGNTGSIGASVIDYTFVVPGPGGFPILLAMVMQRRRRRR